MTQPEASTSPRLSPAAALEQLIEGYKERNRTTEANLRLYGRNHAGGDLDQARSQFRKGVVEDLCALIPDLRQQGEELERLTTVLNAGWQTRSTWRHVKTGGQYDLLSLALVEATLVSQAVYRGANGTVWIRPLDEFMDGRFVPEDTAAHELWVTRCVNAVQQASAHLKAMHDAPLGGDQDWRESDIRGAEIALQRAQEALGRAERAREQARLEPDPRQ